MPRPTDEEIIAALEPLAEKFLTPDDFEWGNWQDDEDYDPAANEETVDDVWIRRGDIRRAREIIKRMKESRT